MPVLLAGQAFKKNFKTTVKLQKDHAYPNCDFLRNENLL